MKTIIQLLTLTVLLSFAACKKTQATVIRIDGSSTVFPITEAIAEEFQKTDKSTKVTVGVSGTGGGFKKLCAKEIDIANASRPIRTAEAELCKKSGIQYIELPVAFDGLAVVAHPKNDWATSITVTELKKLWAPEAQGQVMKWSDVRAGWPAQEIHLYGPGVDSGTYDYFTAAIVGKEHASRGDYTSSEDDNVLVQGISSDINALGFFGLAYYEANQTKLKLLGVDDEKSENGQGPIQATLDTVRNGTYQPLSRPIFIYVSTNALTNFQVDAFVSYYIDHATNAVRDVGYVPLSDSATPLIVSRFKKRVVGSMFAGGSQVGVSLESLLEKSNAFSSH